MQISSAVVWTSLVLSAVLFLAAVLDLQQSWGATKTAKAIVEKSANESKAASDTGDPVAQSALDFKEAWEGLAELASALKDLDRSSRLFVLSLAFLAVAATGQGLNEIADAVAQRS